MIYTVDFEWLVEGGTRPIPPPASSPILRIGNTYGVSTGQREPQREPSPVADCSAIKTAIDGYCPTSPFLNSLGTRERFAS
jgi:hypothetical protein